MYEFVSINAHPRVVVVDERREDEDEEKDERIVQLRTKNDIAAEGDFLQNVSHSTYVHCFLRKQK